MRLSISGYADPEALRAGLERYVAAKSAGKQKLADSIASDIVRALEKLINYLAREKARDRAVRIEDLCQTGRVAVIDAIGQYLKGGVTDPLPYFRSCIVNAMNHEAADTVKAANERDPAPKSSHVDLIDDADRRIEIAQLVSQLPAAQQAILQLHFWEDMSQVEIAAQLGITQQAVARKISAALNALRGLIERD